MFPSRTLFPPFLAPRYRFRRTGRLSSGSSLAARDRGDACQRSLRNCPRSGSWLLQPPLPGGEGVWQLETRDLSLSPERLRPADVVQDGNSRFCTVICQRGGFSSFLGSERRVLSDPDPSIFKEAIEVHVGGDGLPVPSTVFRTVDRSPGLHQGLRGRVSVGTHSWDQTSPLSGRLVGSLLLGAGSQTVRPVAALALSHPRDCDKREEVRSRALADCEVSRHDHRYRGFSVSGASQEIPDGSGELLYHGRSPSSALAGDPRSPGIARAAGPSRSPSDALLAVASEGALVPRVRPSLTSSALATGSETGHVLVDGEGSSVDGGSIRDTCSGSSPVFGRVLFGMGRSPSRSTRVGVWSDQEKLLHINLLEMKALFLALQAFREDVIGHHETAMCDNSTVVAYVNKQGGMVSRALCLLTSRLLRWTESFDVHLDARYLPGQDNVLADTLSRRGQVVGTEWSLHPQVARSLLRAWGNPSIDLFATCLNAKLPLYCSLVPDPQAVFEDAFRHPWDDLALYAFPPFPLVGRVIARVRESSRVAMTLVAPLWPEKEWFADLLLLLTQPPLALPWWDSLLRQPHCNLFHQGVHSLNLHSLRLKRHFRKSGFSGRAARVLSGCLRSSTSRLYQSRWQIFCGWCRGRGVAPVNATVPVVVDFLIHLRHDKGLSVSAVKGYSSALNSVLALKG